MDLLPFKNLRMSSNFGLKIALLAKFTQSLNCSWLPPSLRETYHVFVCSSVPLVSNIFLCKKGPECERGQKTHLQKLLSLTENTAPETSRQYSCL